MNPMLHNGEGDKQHDEILELAWPMAMHETSNHLNLFDASPYGCREHFGE